LAFSAPTIAVLAAVAFAAGVVDAIAGGGGLLTLPALLAAGIPPQQALGTNKGQSVFGSAAALARYWRGGLVDAKRARLAFPAGFLGSVCGALLVLALDPHLLRPIVLALLVGAGAFVAFRPAPKSHAPPHRVGVYTLLIAGLIGAYDGFFGPGCGTFLIVAFVAVLGDEMTKATAEAKVVNFASNLAAVGLFGLRGIVLWQVALPMAVAQFLGGTLGAHLAVRGGGPLIRRVVLLVVVALVVRLGYDLIKS
jgi:uncharacterized membrane protein YfcA